jgi:hypothetical protein
MTTFADTLMMFINTIYEEKFMIEQQYKPIRERIATFLEILCYCLTDIYIELEKSDNKINLWKAGQKCDHLGMHISSLVNAVTLAGIDSRNIKKFAYVLTEERFKDKSFSCTLIYLIKYSPLGFLRHIDIDNTQLLEDTASHIPLNMDWESLGKFFLDQRKYRLMEFEGEIQKIKESAKLAQELAEVIRATPV